MRPMLATLLAVVFMGVAGCTSFHADLTSRGTVPKSKSIITGDATLEYNDTVGTFQHMVRVAGLKDITGAAIHMLPAKKGCCSGCSACEPAPKVGPVVVQLGSAPVAGVYAGVISQGTFGPEAFVGPLQGHGVTKFVKALREGRLYVEVTTTEFPDGEIRGKFKS